ncbi:hypothetical protein ID866_10550 [Astraeus odoratus]|nr:hypothetical protein ID866_10550 [Astraeus odoratus]
MRNAWIGPSAMSHHSGTSQTPHTAPETSKADLSTKTDRCFAGTSSALKAVQASSTNTSAQAVETQTMEHKTAPTASQLTAHLESKTINPIPPRGMGSLTVYIWAKE